jgi:hypothetical protein
LRACVHRDEFKDAPKDRLYTRVHRDECVCVVNVLDVLCNSKKIMKNSTRVPVLACCISTLNHGRKHQIEYTHMYKRYDDDRI